MMKSEIVLVLGGTRSGKSEFAEKYVLHRSAQGAYIATAEILDAEMEYRVKLHQERRKHRWLNFEAPYDAEKILPKAGEAADAILFDSLTVYISNLIYGKDALQGTTEAKAPQVRAKIEKILAAAKKTGKTVVFVASDVGGGIVPDNAMAREFQDLAGWVNQQVGNAADKVFYVIAGQAVDIKKLAFKEE
jgi:adenosylcobinamide kinase/adenosylcobinamide-phosphate guanylyltransferase